MNPVVPPGLESALEGQYRLVRELGAGGMATVYLARDLKHGRDVALKVLRPELASALGAERFLAEIRTTAALHHPHILPLFDSGHAGGFLFYAMPYVEGESLRAKLTREGQLPVAEAVRIATAVAGALDYAHRHNVIHRDIKPDNILLHDGEPIVADFGIALAVSQAGKDRLTATGLSIGTPQYMSPEQATGGKQLDARSDIYSLGAVLYEMLAGEAPFTGPSVHAIIAKLLTEHPIRLRTVRDTVPGYVDVAVQRALATAPVDRFASAAEFAAALGNPAGPTEVPRSGGRGRRVGVGVGVLALLGVAGWWVTQDRAGAQPLPELERVQLTFTGNAFRPAVSPDGKRVAYLNLECGVPQDCAGDIMITDVPATTALTVVRGVRGVYQIQWTRDGRFIYYSDYGDLRRPGTFLVSTLGGTPQFIGVGSAAQLGSSDTLIVAEMILNLAEGIVKASDWLRVVPISGGIAVDSIRLPRQPSKGWEMLGSIDGGRRLAVLLYDDSTWTALLVDRRGAIHDSLAPRAYSALTLSSVVVTPAGDALLVTEERPGQQLWDVLRLPFGRVHPGKARVDTVARQLRLTEGVLTIGPSGAAAYNEARTDWTLLSILKPSGVSEVESRVLLSGTGSLSQPRVDRAGKQVLFVRPVGASDPPLQQLIAVPLDGGDAITVGPPKAATFNFNWSADGSRVLISDTGSDGTTISEVDLSTGTTRQLGGKLTAPARGLAGLPGGGAIASSCIEEHCELHLRGVPGRADTTIVPMPNGRFAARQLLPRPDGLAVARWSYPIDSAGVSAEILETDLHSGRSRVLARFSMDSGEALAEWTDNTHLDFFRPRAGGAGWHRLETTTGKITLVAKLSQPIGQYDLSADGRRGALVVSRQRSDIILIPNFGERLK